MMTGAIVTNISPFLTQPSLLTHSPSAFRYSSSLCLLCNALPDCWVLQLILSLYLGTTARQYPRAKQRKLAETLSQSIKTFAYSSERAIADNLSNSTSGSITDLGPHFSSHEIAVSTIEHSRLLGGKNNISPFFAHALDSGRTIFAMLCALASQPMTALWLALLTFSSTAIAAEEPRYMVATIDGSQYRVRDDRRPALYTADYGDCLGESLINVTRFDAAYYRDNMTVLFHLEGETALESENIMMSIGVYAYGESRFELTFNPCSANIQR